jgi:hypothetical protein
MYFQTFEWTVPSYHRRWSREVDDRGQLVPPPGVPREWDSLWQTSSDFERCIIYAASYQRAIAVQAPTIPTGQLFIYRHEDLRTDPGAVLSRLSGFLGLQSPGLQAFARVVDRTSRQISSSHEQAFLEFGPRVEASRWDKILGDLRWAADAPSD